MRRCSPRTLVATFLLIAPILSAAPVETAEATSIVSRIKRVPIESKALAAIGYSKKLRALEIEFRNGAVYRYLDVATEIHAALMAAPSKARFYHENIKGKYRSLRVRPRSK